MARNKIDKGVTLIAPNTEVVGDIRFADQLFVNGRVTGNVYADDEKATLIVSDAGCITGEVHVPNVVINGLIDGDVYAGARVELAQKAQVRGNLHYKLIEMALGAVVDGQLLHDNGEKAEASRNVHSLPFDGQQKDGQQADAQIGADNNT